MANKRISALDDITLVGGTSTAEVNANDILPITDVDDTTGSLQGTTKAVKVSDLMGEAPVQSVNTQTGAVVLDADDVDDASTSHKFVTASDITNLGNLSGTNTGDQDLSSYQLQPAEGAFVDGDKTKLDGIEAGADVTDATNVTAAGALMDTEVTNLAQVKAFDSSDYATAAHTHAIDDLSDVTITSASNEDVVKYNGSAWVNGQVSVDVDTPLNTALRGTENQHIGANPDQSFRVMDNPNNSAMVIADEDGNVTYLLKDSAAEVRVAKGASGTPSRFALASDLPAFVLENDSGEPDIEVTEPTSGEKISVISGDSDTKGANGLPIRQGYNLPDIGANPAPILISGGSIA